MANDSTSFFYWYRRYKVRAVDMTAFQDAMAETARGLGEGIMGAAVLRGMNVTPASGFSLNVSAGIATAASGYLEVINSPIVVDASAAGASGLPCRSLLVVTPNPTDANFISSPTDPFTQVPLNQLQRATAIVIPGTPSTTPEYPSKGPNDVILAGLIVPAGVSNITAEMLDFEVRDTVGLNSLIGQNQVRFDNRLRPYRSNHHVLGIKPSQNIGSSPLGFSYPGRLTPSLYPLTAGSFTPLDSFIDFETGAISGGDATTPMFSVVVPSGNNSIVCQVTLTQQDTLHINFSGANEGGYAACLGAIKNQIFTGPGSLPAPDGNFGIAYIILTSVGGVLSDIQVFDGRPFLGSGAAAAKYLSETPTGAINSSNNVFTLSKTPMDPESLFFMVDSNTLEDTDYQLNGNVVTITNPSFVPAAGQTVYAKYLIFGAVSNTSGVGIPAAKFKQEVPGGVVDGSNTSFVLSSVPVDPDSLDFWVDENVLELTDYTLVGSTVTITNPDFIPQLGQSVYAKYLYLGVISGGGGGGGTSGYAAFGSRSAPIIIGAAGITPTLDPLQEWFIKSSGGAVAVTGNGLAAGSKVGQQVKIKVVDGTNFPYFSDGGNLDLSGEWPNHLADPSIVNSSTIALSWDGAFWSEDSRR